MPALAVAAFPAAAQLRVEPVQDVGVDPGQRQMPEGGTDVQPDDPLVPDPGGRFDVQDLQVAVQQLVQGRLGGRIALLFDLAEQPGARLLRQMGGPRAGGDGLGQV
jgi:hypothetical protein